MDLYNIFNDRIFIQSLLRPPRLSRFSNINSNTMIYNIDSIDPYEHMNVLEPVPTQEREPLCPPYEETTILEDLVEGTANHIEINTEGFTGGEKIVLSNV